MDIFLSSLELKNNTRETVALTLSNEIFTASKKTFGQKFINFVRKKSTIYAFIVFCSLIVAPSDTTFANETSTKTFVATAYYSPLPNQENYYRGSYEADKKLNGEGNTASDGTPVFVWMIAAPKSYTFGTKINLHGLWVVSVHDRGGAISAKNNYDRIDIWMGYGDEWLKRTLAWWKRELTGEIVDKNTPVSLNLENIIQKAPSTTDIVLQKLQAIGYDTNGKNFKEIVTQFQLDNQIIPSRDDEAAGIYGPKTTAKLNELYNNRSQKIIPPTQQIETSLENIVDFSENDAEKTARERSQNMQTTSLWEYSESVKNLQNFLKSQNLFEENIDGIMSLTTLHSLRKYQYNHNIAQTGRTDVRTQQFIRADLLK